MKNKDYVKDSTQRLINASKKAVDILIEEIEQPLDPELSDEKRRNAIKAKRECFEDCQELIRGIASLEAKISSKDSSSSILDKEKDFEGSFAEKYAGKGK